MLEHDLLVCVLTFCDIDIISKICYKRFPILYYSGEMLKDAEAIRARCWTDTCRYMRKMLEKKSNTNIRNVKWLQIFTYPDKVKKHNIYHNEDEVSHFVIRYKGRIVPLSKSFVELIQEFSYRSIIYTRTGAMIRYLEKIGHKPVICTKILKQHRLDCSECLEVICKQYWALLDK
jgi:hypothetical protein